MSGDNGPEAIIGDSGYTDRVMTSRWNGLAVRVSKSRRRIHGIHILHLMTSHQTKTLSYDHELASSEMQQQDVMGRGNGHHQLGEQYQTQYQKRNQYHAGGEELPEVKVRGGKDIRAGGSLAKKLSARALGGEKAGGLGDASEVERHIRRHVQWPAILVGFVDASAYFRSNQC